MVPPRTQAAKTFKALWIAVLVVLAVALQHAISTRPKSIDHRRLSEKTVTREEYTLQNGFAVVINSSDNDKYEDSIQILHNNQVLWTGIKGSFVQAAKGRAIIREERGSFEVKRDCARHLTHLSTIRQVTPSENKITIEGDLLRQNRFLGFLGIHRITVETSYRLDIYNPMNSSTQLSFTLLLPNEEQGTEYNRLYLQHETSREEKIFGFGEQFTHLDMRGRLVNIITSENGILRGEPGILNFMLNIVGVNGQSDSSYAPAPYYLTSEGKAFFLENYELSQFDMRDKTKMAVKIFVNEMRGRWIYSASLSGNNENAVMLNLIESYTEYTGQMTPLPDWMNRGAVVGMQGGTEKVLRIYEQLTALDTPMAAFWLQDWVGRRQTSFGSQLWWNWDLDGQQYPNWDMLVTTLNQNDIRVMTYISPFLVEVPDDYQGERLYEFAKENGYFVLVQEGSQPYMIENTDFSASMIDLTNPEARNWMKGIINKNVIGVGASGWMADFGEALPLDATLASGVSGELYHNRYAEEWARLNQEAVADANRTGDIVFFTRGGFTRSPGFSTLFWEGDQMVTWDENDGLKSAITGLLSSGLSGFSLNHNDIGGYTSIKVLCLVEITRSRELLFRWMEMNAFTAVFRTHEGIQPENNVQFYTDEETLHQFSKFAKIYASLSSYREALMAEASEKGYPVVRHPFLHYPNDPVTFDLKYQWMLGSVFMVSPVTEEGRVTVTVYLPEGNNWTHIWTSVNYTGGSWYQIDAPIGEPAVFFQAGNAIGESFIDNL